MCVSMGVNRTVACPPLQGSPQAEGSAADRETTRAMPAVCLFHAHRTASNQFSSFPAGAATRSGSRGAATRSGSRGPNGGPSVQPGRVPKGGHRHCVVSLFAIFADVKKCVGMCLSQPDRLKRVQDEAQQLEVPVSVRFHGHGAVIDLIVQLEKGPKHDGFQHAAQVEHFERGQELYLCIYMPAKR